MKKFYENHSQAIKSIGDRNASLFIQRIQEIEAAENLALLNLLPGRLHPLHGTSSGQYALDLVHPKRLIIEPLLDDGQVSPNQSTKVIIIKIVDYH